LTLTNGYIHLEPEEGGAVYNAGSLNISYSTISGNSVDGVSAVGAFGGGIYNAGELTLSYSSVSQNLARNDFVAGARGGGVYNAGTMTLSHSTVWQNQSFHIDNLAYGNGIFNAGTLTVDSSTISLNTGYYASAGGAIYNQGTLRIGHSTITHNAVFGEAGGIYGPVQLLRDTILAGNQGNDLTGQISSSGYNLIGNTHGASGFNDTDLLNVNPMLGPLHYNGGPTPTHALLPGSPAIDAGDNTGAPEWDQRGPGFPRIVNDVIDIGAFEVQQEDVAAGASPRLSSSVVGPLSVTQALPAPVSLPLSQGPPAPSALAVAQVASVPDLPTAPADYFWIGEGTFPDQAWWEWDPANSV
jgi:hypothetical protein